MAILVNVPVGRRPIGVHEGTRTDAGSTREEAGRWQVSKEGPLAGTSALIEAMSELMEETPLEDAPLCAIVGLPLRLDYKTGTTARPAILPSWDGFEISEPFREAFGCPVIIENDANLRALGESRSLPVEQSPLLTMKIGTGIGAGLIFESGTVHHGSVGASGEIGHVKIRSAPEVLCACGQTACLEAVATVPVLLQQ